MKTIVALMCLAVASAVEYSADWQEWKDLFGKSYECEHEELARYTVYVANKAYIEEHNKNADAHGYTLKMNEFGDLVRTCMFNYSNTIFKCSPRMLQSLVVFTMDLRVSRQIKAVVPLIPLKEAFLTLLTGGLRDMSHR